MEKQIIVTDITRFSNKDIICLAGLDENSGDCVRPLRNGRDYFQYAAIKKLNIQPGSILEGTFTHMNARIPHSEDFSHPGGVKLIGTATSQQFENCLCLNAVDTIEAGFGSLPENRVFPILLPPKISIITLRLQNPKNQLKIVEDGFNNTKIKAHITDANGFQLSFTPITDLGFSDHVAQLKKTDPNLTELNNFIHNQETVYLRIGLSRVHNFQNRNGYWVQLNGIYTFPNYRTDLRTYV